MINILFILVLLALNSFTPIVLDEPNTVYDGLNESLPPDTAGTVITIRADNITLQNSIVDGGFVGKNLEWQENRGILVYNCRDIIIDNCQIFNTGFDGIHVVNSKNVRIINCDIENCGEGILFENSVNCSVIDSYVMDIGNKHKTTQDGIEWSSCRGGKGISNQIENINGSGYDIFNSSGIEISGGVVSNADICKQGLAGISIQGTDGRSDFNTFDGVKIFNTNNAAAMAFYRASWNKVVNCDISGITGPDGNCILIADNVSLNNMIYDNFYRDYKGEAVYTQKPAERSYKKGFLFIMFFVMMVMGGGMFIMGILRLIKRRRKIESL